MIELKDIVVKFGDFEALHNINVNVKEGEFFTFLGPSGCGKTTTLRTITGFIEPVSGTVSVNDQDITHVPIEKRNIGIVFQSYALFPTMTVYDNIAFGLKLKKLKRKKNMSRFVQQKLLRKWLMTVLLKCRTDLNQHMKKQLLQSHPQKKNMTLLPDSLKKQKRHMMMQLMMKLLRKNSIIHRLT